MPIESNLKSVLEAICLEVGNGHISSEAQIKQSVIMPILMALKWEVFSPKELKAEYKIMEVGSVDYALFFQNDPQVFIKVKRAGYIDVDDESGLFSYAAENDIPFLIFTDGERWDFHLGKGPESSNQRRFLHMELRHKKNIPEYLEHLAKYLQKNSVFNGNARKAAEQVLPKQVANDEIPEVWNRLLNKPDETIRDLLAEEVESVCGCRPDLDEVEEFLRNQIPTLQPPLQHPPPIPPEPVTRRKIIGFELDGEAFKTGAAIGTLEKIIIAFGERDPNFMEKLAGRTKTRKRRLVATDRNRLYQKEHLIKECSLDLKNGWWLGTNLSSNQIRKHIETACSIAGVGFGRELKLIEQ